MHIAWWVAAGLLAFAFLVAGLTKITQPKQRLYDSGLTYVEDLPVVVVKLIGLLEVAGALALVLPVLLSTATILVPVAALGLAALMLGGVIVHLRRHEPFLLPLAFGALAVVVAIFGDYPC